MMEESASKPNTPAVESSSQDKTKELSSKEQREQDIYNNFATPLIGTFLNLPPEPVMLKCPACGIIELTQVEDDLKWWADEINRVVACLWLTLCCCCCLDLAFPCKQTDRNHYCKNCGCYFGRSMKYAPIKPKKSAK